MKLRFVFINMGLLFKHFIVRLQSGQMHGTVTPSTSVFDGSNPSLTTIKKKIKKYVGKYKFFWYNININETITVKFMIDL